MYEAIQNPNPDSTQETPPKGERGRAKLILEKIFTNRFAIRGPVAFFDCNLLSVA
jgi:hypothetical protein